MISLGRPIAKVNEFRGVPNRSEAGVPVNGQSVLAKYYAIHASENLALSLLVDVQAQKAG
jgi:hypothetical protein